VAGPWSFLGKVTRAMKISTGLRGSLIAPALTSELLRRGYQPLPGPPEDQQLDFVKGQLDVSFALLDKDEAGRVVIAGGPWKGEPCPEAGMVHPQLGQIESVRCVILDPNAQIEIKRMMPIWVPGRPRRQKDVDDIARLEPESALSNLR
jgi:hypothetical protein